MGREAYYRDSLAPTSQPASCRAKHDYTLYQFFSSGGVLSRTHPAYEFRRGQLQMAQAVEQALEEKRHLIVEAGTGTGKTLAYLLPVIRSGKRVLISTGTKNLQEQLFYKDIPFLEQALYPNGEAKLRVCYMKGRANYLCRKKLYDLTDQPVLSGLEEIEQYRAIAAWEKTTQTGDRSELASLPEASALWPKLDARSEACLGQKCSSWDRCFITEMHRRAMESDIIIVNHHLFFADLSIKQATEYAPDAGILPEVGAVVFDEAHELEGVAGSYFGVSVSNLRIEDLIRDVESSLQRHHLLSATIAGATRNLRERSQFFFALLPPGAGRFAFQNRPQFLEENGDEFIGLMQALGRLASEIQNLSQKPEEVFSFVRRIEELQVQFRFLMESEDRNTVFWIERRGGRGTSRDGHGVSRADKSSLESGALAPESKTTYRRSNVFLQATPIDVAPILKTCLFDQLDCAVLTSATLAVGGGFEYIRQRLGVEHARELVLPSHFLLGELEFPMLLQGDAPKSVLLEEFRLTPHAVLFATSSFWQGVDVQGEQLSSVIIDRLPFAVPTDPVVAARVRAVDEAGGNAFFQYQVPAAVITLKQGFGRLIRSLHDRGLLCLLDNRMLNKRYGRVFLESLPNYRKTVELKDVESFFAVH